ncbi:MAG TPA: glycosyltransferase family 4 protein, partial [Propylenella sp.]|nr:glycosyltransferase family 4 protein [Propylenella sp.]
YFSFAFSAAMFGLFKAGKFDLLYVYPPPPAALAAALICAVRRRPFVMDIQDLWPDSVIRSGMPGTRWMERVLTPMCNFAYRRATRIVAQSHGIARRLTERGVPRDKISVVYNWAHEDGPTGTLDLAPYGFAGRFNIVYGGNLGLMQGLDTLIRAAQVAAREVPNLQLTLIGNGADRDRLLALVRELDASAHVRIAPGIPRDQIGDVFAAADVLALHLIKDPLFAITVPHKTQSYMAAGRPILVAVEGEAASLVTEAGAGVSAESGNVVAIAAAMVRLARTSPEELQAMGEAGRREFGERFTLAAAIEATDAAIQQAYQSANARGRSLTR